MPDKTNQNSIEESLDPQDWEAVRETGHRMLDDMIDYLQTVRDRPPWRHAPENVKAQFNQPVPQKPQPLDEIYEDFLENVLPYPSGNIHPRFWGWVLGTGTITGSLAEMLATTMNVGASGGLAYHSANYVEHQVIDWFKQIMGFPGSASGLLASGCSAANLIGLAVARNAKAGFDLHEHGLQAGAKRLVVYASEQAHSSIHKAVELLGLGCGGLRIIPVNSEFQIDLDALQAAIREDRQNDTLPICIVGAAGTTNTGAVDDLEALADICLAEDIWLHVDGAFGAWAVIAPRSKDIVRGLDRADSLAFDLHKWMYMPYEIACVLVQNEQAHRDTFSYTPDYLAHGAGERGMTGLDIAWLHDYGFQLSRGFRALKAWMLLREHGLEKFGRLVQQNIDQAGYLAELVRTAPELELTAPVPLNVVCFRYIGKGIGESGLDELNKHIEVELQERGIAVVSGTIVRGKYALHAAITNHRSVRADFDILVKEVTRIGREYSSQI